MKIKEVKLELLFKQDNLVIEIPKGQHLEANELIGIYDETKDFDITIKKRRKRRSLDANAYFWTLCKKLAKVLKTSETDVYRKMISEVGVYETIVIKDEAIKRFTDSWEHNGLGWICTVQSPCKTQRGFSYVRTYIGSSKYNTEEMARLIDNIVHECNQLGIETMTPLEIQRLKEEWR
ncbi:hypothetical protein ACGCUP_01010 [Eubacteriales bacterium KG125]